MAEASLGQQCQVCLLYQAGGSHAAICRAAERQFRAIREAVAARAAPATLKAAFLEPLARDLPAELAVHVFARADADFMGLFVGAGRSWRLSLCERLLSQVFGSLALKLSV